jgi:hypothetical protein
MTPRYIFILICFLLFSACRKTKVIEKDPVPTDFSGVFIISRYTSMGSDASYSARAIITSSPQSISSVAAFGEDLGPITVNDETLVYNSQTKTYDKILKPYNPPAKFVHHSSALGDVIFENNSPFSADPLPGVKVLPDTLKKSDVRIPLDPAVKFDEIKCSIHYLDQLSPVATQTVAAGGTSIDFTPEQASLITGFLNELTVYVRTHNDQVIDGKLYRFTVETIYQRGVYVK